MSSATRANEGRTWRKDRLAVFVRLSRISGQKGSPSVPFRSYRDNYSPETLTILESAFNEAWDTLVASGGDFNQDETRRHLAELIISFAAEGESDPKRLKQLALAALPRAATT
jgi:hypothetical protein